MIIRVRLECDQCANEIAALPEAERIEHEINETMFPSMAPSDQNDSESQLYICERNDKHRVTMRLILYPGEAAIRSRKNGNEL